jgi:hypothetical protein
MIGAKLRAMRDVFCPPERAPEHNWQPEGVSPSELPPFQGEPFAWMFSRVESVAKSSSLLRGEEGKDS